MNLIGQPGMPESYWVVEAGRKRRLHFKNDLYNKAPSCAVLYQ